MADNGYLSVIDEDMASRRAGTSASLYSAADSNPDAESALVKISRRSGIPVEALRLDNGMEGKRRIAAQRASELHDESPEVAYFLSDPENAKAMHDDVDALKGLETLITGIGTMSGGKVVEGLYGLFKSGRSRTVAKAMGEGIGNSPALVNEALARTGQMAAEFVDWSLQAFPDPTNIRKRVSQRIKESADFWKYAAKERQTEWKPGTAESYVQQAGQSIGTSLLAAPFGIGGEGAALTMFGLFGSGGYETMREAGKSVPEAAVMSTANRIMEGLTEKIGLDRLYKGTGPILKKAVQFVLGDVAGEEINTLYNVAVDRVTINPDMTMADVVQQVVDTAIVTGIAAPVQGGTFHGAAKASEFMYDRYIQNQRVKYTVDFLSALGDSVGASKSFERLPEKVQELIKRLKEQHGGAIDNVYMPADAWSMLWQDSNVDPAQMAEEVIGNRQDYLDALAAGGDLVIPLEDFVTLTKTGKYEDILQDVKLSQGDMTARQYEEAKKTEEEDIKSILESVKGEDDTTDKAIFNDVLGQLLGTGMERSTAESQAALWQSTMRTLATRAGLDPIDLYRKYNPRIVRPLPEVLTNRLRVDMQLDPILDRLRAGDMPKEAEMFGPSLGEFVRSKGGLVDAAGELKSLGAGKLIKKDGMELDRAREQAVEAGYLPEDATIRDFLDALDNELRGKPIYSPGNQNDKLVDERQTLDQMREFLEQSGIDLNEVDNEQARKVLGQGVLWQSAFHGSPHTFDKFSTDAIGTGEGAQAYGYGLYFAEKKEVAEYYKRILSNRAHDELGQSAASWVKNYGSKKRALEKAKAQYKSEIEYFNGTEQETDVHKIYRKLIDDLENYNPGRLYEVELAPNEDEYLLWDKPLSEQSAKVKGIIFGDNDLGDYIRRVTEVMERNGEYEFFPTGVTAYMGFAEHIGSQKAASEYLHSIGIRGIKYLDGTSRGKGDGNYNYVIFSDEDVTITQVEQRKEGEKRGFFDLSANVIGLLKNADLSTFLHESGHFYFKVLQDLASDENAPQQIKDDYATLLKWFGTDKPEVKHLEMFAEGFEQYFGEGKAPTPELQTIFKRFEAWILHVYRTLKAFKVPLTDEVRGVFDRMVATDEELAAARDEAFAKPIFATAEDAGMTETEFNAYLADAINANEREATRLKKQLMSEFYREQKRWWKENRAIMRQEVEAEAKENPVYEVLQVLMTGKQFDGTDSPLGAFKLSKDELVDRYGKDFLKRLPKAFGSIYSVEGGTSVDMVAEAYGFASGDELVQKLIEAPKMKEWIEAETDRRMREEFGDEMTDGTLADEAMAAIHSDDRAKMLRAELAAIRKKQREVKPYTDAAKADAKKQERQIQKEREYERRWLEAEKNLAVAIERGAMQAEIERLRQEKRTAEAMRRAARQGMYGSVPSVETFKLAAMLSIGNKKIWQINPDYYFRGEQKAAKEAFDAAAKGDYAAAGEAKQRQLLNHYLYREARQAKADSEKIREHVKDVQSKAGQERLAKAGNGFLQQVNGLLERYQFQKTTNKELDERGSLKAWVEKMEQEGLMFPISDEILDSATTVNYREATIDELRAFNDALRILEGAAKMWRQFNTSVDQREWEDVEHELFMALRDADLGSTKELNRPNDKAFTLKDKGAKQWRRFDAAHMKMEQIVEWLDGGEINGPWARYFFDQADRAQTLEYDYHARITAKLQELNDSMPKQWLASLFDKTPLEGVSLPNMDGRDATRFTLISIALNTGNEGNLQRLMDGNGWTENEINEALDKLTAEDWKYIQGVWDVVDSLWPDIVALQERVCGLPPKKVEAREITNRHGTFRGGYFPIAFDPFTKQGEKQAQATESVESFMGLRYGKATTATGHLKERAQKVNSALLLDFEQVITRHMSSVIKDLSHREAVFNLNRILQSENIKAMLKDKLGEDYYRNMKEWLQTLINDRAETYKQNLMFWPAVMRSIRTNTAIVTMGWKISTFLTQFAGFGPSVDVVGYGAYAKALTKFMLHPRQTWEMISEMSGEMRHRANTIDRDIKEELLRLRGVTGKMAAIKRTAFYLAAMSDRMVSIPTWLAGYANAQKENLSEHDCIRAGDRAVRLSQGGGGAKDLAGVQRQEQFMKLVTMYYTPFSVLYARLRDVGHTTHGVKDLPRAVARSIALVILPAVMGELLAGRGPDDDEDKVWWMARKTVLYPFQTVPIIRDLANLYEPIMAAIGGAPAKWRPGYKMSPIEDSVMKVWRAISNLDDAWEGDKEWDDVAWDMFEASGYIFGLPTAQTRITGEYLYDLLTDGDNTDNISGVVFRRRK